MIAILDWALMFHFRSEEQPAFYQSLTGHLSPDEQNVIQSVFAQAEALQVMAQASQAQGAQAAGTAPPAAINGGAS